MFENREDLIVLMKNVGIGELGEQLLGPCVDGKQSFYPIPGAFLTDTDFKTFENDVEQSAFEKVYYLYSEVLRQNGGPAYIAKFSLEKLMEVSK
jgi:hypothetical protein